jgi:hypothetical protein
MGRPTKAFQAFRALTDRLLAVPRATIQERLTQHRAASAQNPRKRGPKPKVKQPSTTDPATESDS